MVPEVEPVPLRQMHPARPGAPFEHRRDEKGVAEQVSVTDREAVVVFRVDEDERAEDRQAGLARLLGVGVEIREQPGVERRVEPVIVQGPVRSPFSPASG